MFKLYFKYGAMGCSKTAQALMCKYNYEQKGKNVLLLKPAIDTRFDTLVPMVTSRIGLKSPCVTFKSDEGLIKLYNKESSSKHYDVIIVDEAQFASKKQIDELKELTRIVPVLCYGLKNNFKTELFEGSKRLLEVADSLMEIKSICKCGAKATHNARMVNGKISIEGAEVVIGADEQYEGVCYWCYKKMLEERN